MLSDIRLKPYAEALYALELAGRLRTTLTVAADSARPWPWLKINGQWVVDFCSNNYLGLANHPKLVQAVQAAAEQEGTGARSSRLIGAQEALTALETDIARWKGAEKALVLNSGYQGNIAVLQGLLRPEDWVFFDRLNHASLIDGVRWSGAQWKRYAHRDDAQLEGFLQTWQRQKKTGEATGSAWIVTDSVFSMDGDCADLNRLCQLANEYGALLMVDEAHGAGVFGSQYSGGLVEAQNVATKDRQMMVQLGTFSKALGSFGAYVAGPAVLIDSILNRGRGVIYSTALPPTVIAANGAAVRLVQQDLSFQQALWKNVAHFKTVLKQKILDELKIPLAYPPVIQSPIIPLVLGEKTLRVSEALCQAGYFVRAIRPPTVPEGSERLRITLSASHTSDQIEGLLEALLKILSQDSLTCL